MHWRFNCRLFSSGNPGNCCTWGESWPSTLDCVAYLANTVKLLKRLKVASQAPLMQNGIFPPSCFQLAFRAGKEGTPVCYKGLQIDFLRQRVTWLVLQMLPSLQSCVTIRGTGACIERQAQTKLSHVLGDVCSLCRLSRDDWTFAINVRLSALNEEAVGLPTIRRAESWSSRTLSSLMFVLSHGICQSSPMDVLF